MRGTRLAHLCSVPTQPLETRIQDVLSRYVSRINARVIAERGRRVLAHPETIADDERKRFLVALHNAAALFVNSSARLSELDKALESEVGGAVDVEPRNIPIDSEADLRLARTFARDMALALKATNLNAQRIATVVSELGRNIVSYTPGGNILLEPIKGRLRIVATDRGKGIPGLSEILDGRYRSTTGLGRGLMGVRQLMDSFDIQTGPQGTAITVEATL